MASNEYREQNGGTLGVLTNCPNCNPPTNTSYKVTVCSNSFTFYVDDTTGFQGNQQVLLAPNAYSVGQVLWIKQTASGPAKCAEIIAVNQPDPSTYYFDISSGPWTVCNQCFEP